MANAWSAVRRATSGIQRWSLRSQLVLILVCVLTAMTVLIGAISITVQRQSLIDRLDTQLQIEIERISHVGYLPDIPRMEAPVDDLRGPAIGSLSLIVSDDTVVLGEVVDGAGEVQKLTQEQISAVLLVAGHTSSNNVTGGSRDTSSPAQIDLAELGTYRVVTRSIGSIDGVLASSGTVVVGQSLAEASRTTHNLIWIFALSGVVGIVLAALAAGYLVGVGTRPLERLAATARRVGATSLASGEVSLPERIDEADAALSTEVGQLGAAFNLMLDNVEHSLTVRQHSEVRLRQFVADASHELRTPLASVSGYAELASRHTDDLPEDVQRSLSRIRSESARMTSMVQDLLLLARLDAGTGLEQKRVELARVVMDATADARVTGPAHIWELELAEDAAELMVLGDAGRLHQVMLNLLTNARTHTPAGTRVTVSLRSAGESYALIQVEDNGPGIDPDLRTRVFDRFVRGDDSRSSAAGSTGLGMSIVAAIVATHRGTVNVESRPGRTVFTVSLPLAASSQRVAG